MTNFLDDWEERKRRALEQEFERFGAPVVNDQYAEPLQGGTVEAYAEPNYQGEQTLSESFESVSRPVGMVQDEPVFFQQPQPEVRGADIPFGGLMDAAIQGEQFAAPTSPTAYAGQAPLQPEDYFGGPVSTELSALQRFANLLNPTMRVGPEGKLPVQRDAELAAKGMVDMPALASVERAGREAGRIGADILASGMPTTQYGFRASPEFQAAGEAFGGYITPTSPLEIAATALPVGYTVGKGLGAGLPLSQALKRGALTGVETLLPTPNLNPPLPVRAARGLGSAALRTESPLLNRVGAGLVDITQPTPTERILARGIRGAGEAAPPGSMDDPIEVLRQKLDTPPTRQTRPEQTSAQAARIRAAQNQASAEGLSGEALIERVKELGATSDPLLQGTGGLGLTQQQKDFIIDRALALRESGTLSPQDVQFNIPRILNQAEDLTEGQRNLLRRIITGESRLRTSGAAASASLEGVIPPRPGVVSEPVGSVLARYELAPDRVKLTELQAAARQAGVDSAGTKKQVAERLSAARAGGAIPPQVPPPTTTGGAGRGGSGRGSGLPPTGVSTPGEVPRQTLPPMTPRLGEVPLEPTLPLSEGGTGIAIPENLPGPFAPGPAGQRAFGTPSAAGPIELPQLTPGTARAPFSISGIPEAANRNIDVIAQEGIRAVKEASRRGVGSRATAATLGQFSDPVVNEIAHRERELREAIIRFADVTLDAGVDPITGQRAYSRPLATVVKNTPEGREVMRLEIESKRIANQFREAAFQARYGNDLGAIRIARETLEKADARRVADNVSLRWYNAFNNSLRELILNFDVFGWGGQQGLRAMRGSTAITTGLIGRVAKLAGHGPDIYPRGDIDEIAQMIIDTVQMGRGGATADITREGLASTPVLGDILNAAATVQFEGFGGTVRKLAYEGLLIQNKALGADVTNSIVRRRIAEMANIIGSTARPAATPRRGAIEAGTALSPRMTRAMLNEVLVIPKTLRSPTDAINTANLVVSTAALAAAGYYLNKEIGLDDTEMDIVEWTAKHMNPADLDFGRIVTKQRNSKGEPIIVDFMPQTQAIRAGVRAINKLFKNDPQGAAEQLARFTAGRASPAVGMGARATGFGYGREGKFYSGFDMPLSERVIASSPMPLGLRTVTEGEIDPVSIALTQSGVTSYGEQGKAAIDRARETARKSLGFDKPYEELAQDLRLQVDADSAVDALVLQNLREQAATGKNPIAENKLADRMERDSKREDALSVDSRLESGEITGAQARRLYDEMTRDLATDSQARYATDRADKALAKIPEKERSPADAARQSYFEDVITPASTGVEFDFDLYERNLRRWEATHPEFTKEQVSPARPLSPAHEELIQARKELEPYFDLQDQAWAQAQAEDARLLVYRDAKDYVSRSSRAMAADLIAGGVPPVVAEQVADKVVAAELTPYNVDVKTRRIEYLIDHPEAVPTLGKWYSVPYGLEVLDPNYLIGAR